MTREEAVKEIEKAFEPAFANYIITALTEGVTASDKEPFNPMVEIDLYSVIKQKYIEREVLDKIRAEIQRLRGCSCSCSDGIIDDVEDIIDKYMNDKCDKGCDFCEHTSECMPSKERKEGKEMKRYIAVIEIDDDEEIVGDANISYTYRSNGTNYGTDESVELKAEDEGQRKNENIYGLNEAWEAARKIVCLPSDGGLTTGELEEIFGTYRGREILKENTAAEIIAKIKEYETRIEVGDEVHTIYNDVPMVVVNIFNEDITGEKRVASVSISGIVSTLYAEELRRTGRHFPQIAEVLKQMKGEA